MGHPTLHCPDTGEVAPLISKTEAFAKIPRADLHFIKSAPTSLWRLDHSPRRGGVRTLPLNRWWPLGLGESKSVLVYAPWFLAVCDCSLRKLTQALNFHISPGGRLEHPCDP